MIKICKSACAHVIVAALLLLLIILSGCGQKEAQAPAWVTSMNRGVSAMGQYQYQEAVQAFEEVLKSSPGQNEATLNLALALFNRNGKGDIEASRQALEAVLKQTPENERAMYFKAILLQHIGNAHEAVPLLEKVAAKRPDDGAVWYVLGICKQRIGQSPEKELQNAVRLRPYLYSAHYQLYQLFMREGREEDAAQHLESFKRLRESPLGESIELPQYNQMGELALARPPENVRSRLITPATFSPGKPITIWQWEPTSATNWSEVPQGAALGDLDGNGRTDIVVPLAMHGPLLLLSQAEQLVFKNITEKAGLAVVRDGINVAVGDFDNDETPDLFVAGAERNYLLKGSTNSLFVDVTGPQHLLLTNGPMTLSALFVDADHDADLDLATCGLGGASLWQNTGEFGFTNSLLGTELGDRRTTTILAVPGDIDRDRDMDLLMSQSDGPLEVFSNELLGKFTRVHATNEWPDASGGIALQDVSGDSIPDLITLERKTGKLRIHRGDGRGSFEIHQGFDAVSAAAASHSVISGFRVADIDLDGDLDILTFGQNCLLLLNDGNGNFVLDSRLASQVKGTIRFLECADINGDLVPDLLVCEGGSTNRLLLFPGQLSLPSTAVAVQPTGVRSRDGRTRSPASGYGVELKLRTGIMEHRRFFTGLSGGPAQSWIPEIIGLGGAAKADYLQMGWPDGVAQVEVSLPAGRTHRIAELQRKISSCPVLFTWNGDRFEFVTDFAGVGGLGYFAAPGTYAPPQVLEHVKIENKQLRAKDSRFLLRITEPMEEAAYIDRLELRAVDHPESSLAFPDERLAISGAQPTHDLLVVKTRLFPSAANGPDSENCLTNLLRIDRTYAYQPKLDRRFIGFCKPHSLELTFDDRLNAIRPGQRVFLFINGYIEYPYSQTVYAAGQSRIGWEPIRVEQMDQHGNWRVIVADGGAPGGMARTMTIDLTGTLRPETRKLRLTTNLEVYYDQVFLGVHQGADTAKVTTVPLKRANLQYAGFAREYSPDGRMPLLYDYSLTEPTSTFHVLKGAYTRYGPVEDLIQSFDDQLAILGPGDELALEFDPTALPEIPAGWTRSYILVSHAYCKDMDLYTGTPLTLDPLPHKGMRQYPYPASERTATPAHQAYLREYNTRVVR